MKTKERIQRVSERGQITLPISWRRRYGSRNIVIRERDGMLEVTPLMTEDERDEEWVTIFDAVRDNNGKGIPIDELSKALKRSLRS